MSKKKWDREIAGDIIFNIGSQFFVAPGVEGDNFYNGVGPYINDLEGLVLHELGHAAIGLGHSTNGPNFPGLGDVMYVDNFPNCCNFINRQLSPQDVAGLQSVYGVPEPSSIMLISIVMACIATTNKRTRHGTYNLSKQRAKRHAHFMVEIGPNWLALLLVHR